LWLRGDSVRLRQVLNNLVGNALKFTDRGGVELRCDGHRDEQGTWALTFDVIDSGRGIGADEVGRIFEPFTQLSPSDALSGTGLGLPLSRALARAMGGDLVAMSSEGGSRLRVKLTLPEAATLYEPTPVVPAVEPRTGRGRALVVDDNRINLRVATAMMERLGFEIETAMDGEQALAMMQREHWTVVLMDCHMPRLDGREATSRWRAIEQEMGLSRVPVVALTASVLASEVASCTTAGMDACLSKPLQLRELDSVLSNLLLDDQREPGAKRVRA
jgi:CheY-like chemotaxis protein